MKIKIILLIIICSAVMTSCADKSAVNEEEFSKTVYAMDTVMSLKLYGNNAQKALDAAEEEIIRLDSMFRRKSTDSEIYSINSQGSAEVSEETAKLIEKALDISLSTNGAFDISIAPVMDLWGFYEKKYYVPSKDEIISELSKVNYKNISSDSRRISVSGGSQLDLGGIAKGFLSERIIQIFKQSGVESGIVSLGGNVQTLGNKPDGSLWNVAIQNPDNESYIGVLTVSGKAVVTSGGYQRFFEHDGIIYHHIIDPKTGYPSHSGVKSVSIVSSDGALADGLSTALFVMGLESGAQYWKENDGFEAVFVTDDNNIYITQGLDGSFKSDYNYNIISK